MNEVLLANLFFIITGSAVLVVATFACIVCYHVITVTKKTQALLERLETSAGALLEEAKTVRERIMHGAVLGRALAAAIRVVTGAKRGRAAPRKKKEDIPEH